MRQQEAHVVYLSPGGSTRRVAEIIADETARQGLNVSSHDLAGAGTAAEGVAKVPVPAPGDLLFVGSPTYALHPVPPVMAFLDGLPSVNGAFGVPFVTYGAVTSGLALLDMARKLGDKEFGVLGGIKVPALHSLLWRADAPLGAGRPDEADEEKIRTFVREVLVRLRKGDALPPEALDYQGEGIRAAAAQASLDNLKAMFPPMALDTDACIQCGVCEEECPSGNISLSPFPVFADRCILCFNCVRLCEPGAVSNPVLPMLEPEIHKRRDAFQEPVETRFFV